MTSPPSDRPSEGVVFLHGISRSFRSLIKLQQAVDKAGFATRNIGYPSREKPLSDLVDDIHPAIAPFTEANDFWPAPILRAIALPGSAAWSCWARRMAAARLRMC